MADMKKKYYYAPTWNHVPNDPRGIALGTVIISPKHVWPPLLAATTNPTFNEPVTRRKVQWTKEREKAGSFGIYTKFLETLGGAGVDLSAGGSRRSIRQFEFEEMTTEEFVPSRANVKDRIERPDVVEYLQGRLFFDRVVYMIIGIKHVSGVTAKQTVQSAVNVEVDVGADATLLTGMPLSGGVRVSPGSYQAEAVSWVDPGAFVFAFRVARITVRRKSHDFKYHPYEHGAMYGSDDHAEHRPQERILDVEIINDGGFEVLDGEEQIDVSRAIDFTASTRDLDVA